MKILVFSNFLSHFLVHDFYPKLTEIAKLLNLPQKYSETQTQSYA